MQRRQTILMLDRKLMLLMFINWLDVTTGHLTSLMYSISIEPGSTHHELLKTTCNYANRNITSLVAIVPHIG